MLPKQFLGENVRKSETFKINELPGDSKCQRKNYKIIKDKVEINTVEPENLLVQ